MADPTFTVMAFRDSTYLPSHMMIAYKVTWPDGFEMVVNDVVKTEDNANKTVLRVFEHEPNVNTPDGAVTMQMWHMGHKMATAQASHVRPPRLADDVNRELAETFVRHGIALKSVLSAISGLADDDALAVLSAARQVVVGHATELQRIEVWQNSGGTIKTPPSESND